VKAGLATVAERQKFNPIIPGDLDVLPGVQVQGIGNTLPAYG
jgi:hypothetical protein